MAQLYVSQTSATVERPAKELKGFERVQLLPGERQHVALELDPRSFGYFDVKSGSWMADARSLRTSARQLIAGYPAKDRRTVVQDPEGTGK